MMKHKSTVEQLRLSPAKETVKKSLWRTKSSSDSSKSPITKAFDFLPWARTKISSNSKPPKAKSYCAANSKSITKINTIPTSSANAVKYQEKSAACLDYQHNIIRNSDGTINGILNEKLHKREAVLKKFNTSRARQVTGRNKSLDINDLISCVEKELSATTDYSRRNDETRSNRFLHDTFIENLTRAKDAYQSNLQREEYESNNNYGNHRKIVESNDVEDEYFYQQQTELAKLYQYSDSLRSTNDLVARSGSDGISPKHILFNEAKTVYFIKKELPVNQINKSYDKERRHAEKILKASLKFKKLSNDNSTSNHSAKSMVLNNSSALVKDADLGNSKKRKLQRQVTSPELYTGSVSPCVPDTTRKRSPSAGRCEQPIRLSPNCGRRKSLTEGPYSSPPHNNANSSTSSMGSAISSSARIINDRPQVEKPRKKLSFREPEVLGRRVPRGQSADTANVTINCLNVLSNKKTVNESKHDDDVIRRRATPNAEITPEKNVMQSQAMRIVRTVGQAFEVCHKFNLHNKDSLDNNDERSDISSSELLDVETRSDQQLSDDDGHNKKAQNISELNSPQRPNHLELFPQTSLNKSGSFMIDEDKSPATPSSPSREINKLKDQLEQQSIQTRQALSQLMMVREQLISETNARIEAQARTQLLLQQNRELLEHLASLGAYNEQHTQGLTSANIGIAPQNHLQLLLQATAGSANNNVATINQQINNLGSINQQLTSLSHQLSGLNQQTQNLQNLQHQQQQRLPHTPTSASGGAQGNSLTPQIATTPLNQSQLHLNVSGSNAQLHSAPVLQQQQTQQQQTQDTLSKDLFSVNQELLNRLQALNLGVTSTMTNGCCGTPQLTPSPRNSFFFVNPMSCSSSNNNNTGSNNYNLLSTPSSMGNLTPSPMGTLNRNSYSNSPITDDMCMAMDQNLNALDEQLMKTISNNNVTASGSNENSRSSSTAESPLTSVERNTSHLNNNTDISASISSSPRFKTVMLKVTDEAGNVTNQRKLSATPSFITRSTSEKVPNRSQIRSQVQRTAWARHTTK